VRAVPRLCEFYPGICLTTEEKARKYLSQGKKNLSQGKKNLSQVKKNLSQNTNWKPRYQPATTHENNTISCTYSLDASDYERIYRSKYVEQSRNNQLSYTVASCWLFSQTVCKVLQGTINFPTQLHLVGYFRKLSAKCFKEQSIFLHSCILLVIFANCLQSASRNNQFSYTVASCWLYSQTVCKVFQGTINFPTQLHLVGYIRKLSAKCFKEQSIFLHSCILLVIFANCLQSAFSVRTISTSLSLGTSNYLWI
jgi:hypothetical protein